MSAYAKLRSEDANPGASTAYRITVRQLEALVRLAEALARLHCQDSVTPAHVHEVSDAVMTFRGAGKGSLRL